MIQWTPWHARTHKQMSDALGMDAMTYVAEARTQSIAWPTVREMMSEDAERTAPSVSTLEFWQRAHAALTDGDGR